MTSMPVNTNYNCTNKYNNIPQMKFKIILIIKTYATIILTAMFNTLI